MTSDGDERVFRLFASIVPVAGASRSILCDLQRSAYYPISLAVHALLTEQAGQTVGAIKAGMPPEEAERVDALFAALVDAELGFWSSEGEAERFPPIDLAYERATPIDNAIVDVNAASRHDYPAIFAQLDELGCAHLELRFYEPITVDALDAILAPTLQGRLRSIQIVVPFADWSAADFERLCDKHARIATISVHGAPRRETVRTGRKWEVQFFPERIESANACGQIHPGYFSTNLATFSEAQRFNTCLNRKVGIDAAGQIKNCPSCTEHHGDAGLIPLADVVARPAFRRLWDVQRDQVEICRDCEYRYICTDCRVFLSDPANPLSKPAKCSYDPYTGVWGGPHQG